MFEIDEGKAEMDYCFTRMMNLNSEESISKMKNIIQ